MSAETCVAVSRYIYTNVTHHDITYQYITYGFIGRLSYDNKKIQIKRRLFCSVYPNIKLAGNCLSETTFIIVINIF